MPNDPWTRRDVLKAAVGAVAMGAANGMVVEAQTTGSATTRPTPMVGIQLGVSPLATGRSGSACSTTCEHVRGSTRCFRSFTRTLRSTAAMPAAGFRGGNFAVPHMRYYKQTSLTYQDMRAPDFGDVDVLARTIPAAKKHGIKTFAWIIEDHSHCPSANWEKLYEVDFHGRPALVHPAGPCFNNPLYRGFVLGLVHDYVRSYDIDGVMWGSERQGGFFNALGAYAHGSGSDPGKATCFCEFCRKKGADAGIDVDRAKLGFAALEDFVRAGRAGTRPRDGYFVGFFRLLLQFPELLAWENLWERSREDLQAAIYKLVKSFRPELPVGWHIWHNVTFSPFHRAEIDYARLTEFSDFIKPVLYDNCAGERIHAFTDSVCQNVFGDLPRPMALEVIYQMQDFKEAPYDRVTAAGFSADYVLRETRRAVDDTKDKSIAIWPGVGIDIPVPAGAGLSSADRVKQSVMAAFKGGAAGVILSRNYPEMNAEHLAGAGAALDELGLR